LALRRRTIIVEHGLRAIGPSRNSPSCELWKELQSTDVARPEHPKVAPIERRQSWFSQSLGDRQNRGIDESDVRVRVLVTDFTHPSVVIQDEVQHLVRTGVHIVQ